jgi:putative endonuclease
MFYVYILQSEITGKYYIGSTKNVSQRLARHNAKMVLSTKHYCPWQLIHTELFGTLSHVRRRELEIKSWKNPAYMANKLGLTT